MDASQLSLLLLAAFLGYAIGRFGHYKVNEWLKNAPWLPHHWVYGIILIIVGYFYKTQFWAQLTIAFGVGIFVSDIKDFFELKIIGPDEENEKKKFWGFD